MIKVLNKNAEEKLYRQECYECSAELEFSIDDTYEGAYGARYLKCPVCNEEIITEIDNVRLTSNNIKFPIHFYHTGKDAVKLDDEKIQEWIREGLSAFENGEAEDFWYAGSGDTFVIILEMEDEYCVYVMKNYWEVDIPIYNT